MFQYDKKLQYPVKISNPNPRLASVIISQYGGPDGELGASLRYLSQRYSKMYGFELWLAKLLGFVTETDGVYRMTLKGAFYYHYYENFYTLAYIDKMWGIMREQAFPERIEL